MKVNIGEILYENQDHLSKEPILNNEINSINIYKVLKPLLLEEYTLLDKVKLSLKFIGIRLGNLDLIDEDYYNYIEKLKHNLSMGGYANFYSLNDDQILTLYEILYKKHLNGKNIKGIMAIMMNNGKIIDYGNYEYNKKLPFNISEDIIKYTNKLFRKFLIDLNQMKDVNFEYLLEYFQEYPIADIIDFRNFLKKLLNCDILNIIINANNYNENGFNIGDRFYQYNQNCDLQIIYKCFLKYLYGYKIYITEENSIIIPETLYNYIHPSDVFEIIDIRRIYREKLVQGESKNPRYSGDSEYSEMISNFDYKNKWIINCTHSEHSDSISTDYSITINIISFTQYHQSYYNSLQVLSEFLKLKINIECIAMYENGTYDHVELHQNNDQFDNQELNDDNQLNESFDDSEEELYKICTSYTLYTDNCDIGLDLSKLIKILS